MNKHLAGPCGLALSILAASTASADTPTAPPAIAYPMTATTWEGAKATFARQEGFPNGLMTVSEGYAVLKQGGFAQGSVEFDIKPLDYADTGILIHRRDAATAEFVYLRADPDCPAANDCVQYAPVTNGRMQWNAYSRYQGPAPVSPKGWNHVRIVVSGQRLRLYVNHDTRPALDVPHLRGLAAEGGIAVKGPAVYANLVVRPGDPGDASPAPIETGPSGSIQRWSLGPVTREAPGRPPSLADMPASGWRPIDAEPDGLVNLARALPRNDTDGLQVAWLRQTVTADSAGERTVDLGFVPRAWLFLNGVLVYAGANFYYPGDQRLTPEGRFSPDNAKVTLRLRKGANEIVLATDDAWRRPTGELVPDHYGWATALRFEEATNLSFGRDSTATG